MTAWHGGYSRLNEKIFDSTKKSRLKEKILYSAKIFSTRGKNSRLGKKDSRLEKKISRPFLSIMAGKISAQPHPTLCIQFLNREKNDKNNTFPLGKQICFTIVWGCAETLPREM